MAKIKAEINVNGTVYETSCPPDSLNYKKALKYAMDWIKWKLDSVSVNPEISILQWNYDTAKWIEIGHKQPIA